MFITKSETTLRIGKDFIDAVTGNTQSHGEIEVNGNKRYDWRSTLPISETEHALRLAAKQECVKITLFISQAR